MNNNIIYTDRDEAIGFYKDLVKVFKEEAINLINQGDYENSETQLENLQEMEQYKDYEGLLIVSDNNGMGFSCNPYKK